MIRTGRVVRIFDDQKIAINLGSTDGVTGGKQISIYAPSVEIEDPQTEEKLGEYRHRKATAKIVAVSEHFSIAGAYPRKEETVPAGSRSFLTGFRTPTVTKTVRGHLPIDDFDAQPIPTGNEIKVGDAVDIEVPDPAPQESPDAQNAGSGG